MLFSSSYDVESQDLLVFSDPSPFFFTTSSDLIINDIAHQEINSNSSIINSLDPPFSLSFFSSNTHMESHQSLLYQGQGNLELELEYEQPQSNSPNLESELTYDLSVLDGSEVKSSEESQMGIVVVDNTYNHQHYVPQSHSGSGDDAESASEIMQRSSSCDSFDGNSASIPYEAAHHDTLMDTTNFQWHALSSLQNSFFTGQSRRVFSAGDLQSTKATRTFQTEKTLLEEANFNKVGHYSPEERKEKISKYRAKRSQRKFNKTIKYACRKTLADNRARIRGRFARNNDDATVIIPKAQCSTAEENEHEFWIDLIEGLNEEVLS